MARGTCRRFAAWIGAWVAVMVSVSVSVSASEPVSVHASGSRAKAVLRLHCGGCHDSSPVPANPRALRIYDLASPDWTATLTERQLRDVSRRMRDRGGMSPAELREVVSRGMAVPPRPTAEEIGVLEDYVEATLASRRRRS